MPDAFACRKGPACQANYFSRISGPFLDRIDLFVDVAAVTATDLSLPPPSEGTAEAAARVANARERQAKRFGEPGDNRRAINADAPGADIDALCALDAGARALLVKAAEQLSLSARAYHRVLKVARHRRSRRRIRRRPRPRRRSAYLPLSPRLSRNAETPERRSGSQRLNPRESPSSSAALIQW